MLKVHYSSRPEIDSGRVEIIFDYYVVVELSDKYNFLLTWEDLVTFELIKDISSFWRISGSRRLTKTIS